MKYIISITTVLTILTAVVFFGSKNAIAGSTITTSSGSVTAIEGGYESSATNTYQSGSSNNTTTNSTSTSNVRSSPPTSSAPMVNSTSNCAFALSGGVQTFSVGISGGKSYVDKTCQLIALSNALSNRGMKIASIQEQNHRHLVCNFHLYSFSYQDHQSHVVYLIFSLLFLP